jgi:predicted ester cyclase
MFQQQLLQSFPDLKFTVHEIVENGDWAAGRWSAQATHSGDGLGVPATGETVKVTGMSMVRASGRHGSSRPGTSGTGSTWPPPAGW